MTAVGKLIPAEQTDGTMPMQPTEGQKIIPPSVVCVGYANVPDQVTQMDPMMGHLYADETALIRGTLFPELDKPFMMYKGARV